MTLSTQDLKRLAMHRRATGSSEGFVPTEPKKKRKNEEFSMQCQLVSWWSENCARFGVPEMLLWHTPNSAVYGGSKTQREKMGAMLKRLGQRSGVPDLFLAVAKCGEVPAIPGSPYMFPEWHHGLFLELKAPKGIVSPEQTAMLAELQRQGYSTAVCWTLEDAQKVISDYLKP